MTIKGRRVMVSTTASYLKVPSSIFGSDPQAQVNVAVAQLRSKY